jgi:kynurenine formamidase
MKGVHRQARSSVLVVFILATAGSAFGAEDSLAKAYRILSSKTFVDLTHRFDPRIPVWEGFGPATFAAAADPATGRPYTIAKDGFRATVYAMVGQYGTHVDPPAHFSEDGATMDQIPLREMILPLVVLDVTPKLDADPSHALGVADVRQWEREHGKVPEGSFAALRTDMYKDFESDPERFRRHPFPSWSLESVKFLFEKRKVVAIGHESLDTDATSDMKSETWLLRNGHWQIEVLAHLDELPATGALIVVSWPKVARGLGFPARAFAILP